MLLACPPLALAAGGRKTGEGGDWSSPGLQGAPAPTGGTVNLRHLRESVALLAARLRQHKAAVALPPELQDLAPQVRWCGEAGATFLHTHAVR